MTGRYLIFTFGLVSPDTSKQISLYNNVKLCVKITQSVNLNLLLNILITTVAKSGILSTEYCREKDLHGSSVN